MRGLWTILLLIVSNSFMTLAWYGHLKLDLSNKFTRLGVFGIVLFSWAIAFFEYCAQVPANRLGFVDNGGPFNLMQLKIIQEVISLTVFVVFALFIFKGETLKWNYLAAMGCIVAAVYFIFMK